MTDTSRQLLKTFDSLSESDQHEIAVEILRRTALVGEDAPTETELLFAAEQIFLELDRREA